ncbi:hypothetical protein [Streptomyces sp. WM6372]|uniref:hypothetical protein n=1 Tax=Streptomyces sp. WM6372 TaxID=1415555 RepID=UPI000AA2D0CF|nr:hypothetical protein [Streptomyces sp. WM6372]
MKITAQSAITAADHYGVDSTASSVTGQSRQISTSSERFAGALYLGQDTEGLVVATNFETEPKTEEPYVPDAEELKRRRASYEAPARRRLAQHEPGGPQKDPGRDGAEVRIPS